MGKSARDAREPGRGGGGPLSAADAAIRCWPASGAAGLGNWTWWRRTRRGLLCIVEVKLRASGSQSPCPVSLWTCRKQQRLRGAAAACYLAANELERTGPVRRGGGLYGRGAAALSDIAYLENAFEYLATLFLESEETDMKYYSTRDKSAVAILRRKP